MFSYIKGIVAHKDADHVVIENNGIGYRLFVSAKTLSRVTVNEKATLHTVFHVREDLVALYGFWDLSERSLFSMLMTVTGIGPKVALSVLSHLSPTELYLAIIREDVKTLTRVPGIGTKSAKRMFVELKEKVAGLKIPAQAKDTTPGAADAWQEAFEALLTLGYSGDEAQEALQACRQKWPQIEESGEMLKRCLQIMAGKQG